MRVAYTSKSSLKSYLVFLLLLFFYSNSFLAQKNPDADFQGDINYVQSQYNSVLEDFNNNQIPSDSIGPVLQSLISDRVRLFTIYNALKKITNDLNEKILALGPVPTEDQSLENEFLSKKRKDLNDEFTIKGGLLSSVNILLNDLDDLINKLSNQRTASYFSEITQRTASIFDKELWKDALNEEILFAKHLKEGFRNYWNFLWKKGKMTMNIFILLVSFLLVGFLLYLPYSKTWKRINAVIHIQSSDPLIQKRLNLVIQPLFRSVLAFISLYVLYWGGSETGLITPTNAPIFSLLIYWITALVFLWNLSKKLFVQDTDMFGLFKTKPEFERSSRLLFFGMFFLFALNNIIVSAFKIYTIGDQLITAETIVNTLFSAVLFFLFFMKKRWIFKENILSDEEKYKGLNEESKGNVKVELTLYIAKGLAIIILVALLLEYINLAKFIYQRIILLAWFVMSIIAVRSVGQWIINDLFKGSNIDAAKVTVPVKGARINFWLDTIWDITLIIFGTPFFLLAVGVDWIDVENWMDIFSTGIKIRDTTISLKTFVNGIITFVIIIIVFRWTASKINERLIEYPEIDDGIRNSIITMFNYLGIIVAVLAAIPAFGFDLSKISIVAGALSVGIGFGLQSIARDFVSGLILLFERPFKIGDWVVVQSGEGYVREIKLRSTIIQTFDMACIVVPNSELVSSSVQNWFYKGKKGRITIPVGVTYNSDPDQVKEILMACAKENNDVLSTPASYVYWEDFGESSLQFQLRVYIKNLDNGLSVRSALRFEILKKFREAGISIPFPQRDLHIVDGSLKNAHASPDKKKTSPKKSITEKQAPIKGN
jgi:small-conductance mechanosensitive channel